MTSILKYVKLNFSQDQLQVRWVGTEVFYPHSMISHGKFGGTGQTWLKNIPAIFIFALLQDPSDQFKIVHFLITVFHHSGYVSHPRNPVSSPRLYSARLMG